MKKEGRTPLHRFRTPGYWPAWAGLALLRLCGLLPLPVQFAIGRWLGRLGHRLVPERRAITRRNLSLAFPELDEDARNALTLAHFEALGISLIEMGLGRWAPDERLLAITRIEGTEHLEKAAKDGVGVILLTAHFTTIEVSGRILKLHSPPFAAVYRRHRSEFVTEILRTGRERSAAGTIEKSDIKTMIRCLRDGMPVWYAPDQSYDRKQSAVLPFFGVPSMTNTATSTLAKLGKAVVMPYFPRRLEDGTYVLTILPPFENFPGDDAAADTARFVEVLEERIRLSPEQYYWIHRKYKNLPPDLPDFYADLDAWK